MTGSLYLRLAFKAFIFWLLFSLAGFFWGDKLISLLTPMYEWTIEQASKNYHADVHLNDDAERKVILAATALRNIVIVPGRDLEAGKTIEASITVLHALVPLVILLTTLVVYPLKNSRQRIALLLLGIPALLLVSILTAPLQLLGNLEIGFMNAVQKLGYSKEVPWVIDWMLLTEGGGRWLIPLLVGILCGAAVGKFLPAKTNTPETDCKQA
ncbi:MAG: hypothetical protein WBN40_08035 [Pseudomonadales bacterium]